MRCAVVSFVNLYAMPSANKGSRPTTTLIVTRVPYEDTSALSLWLWIAAIALPNQSVAAKATSSAQATVMITLMAFLKFNAVNHPGSDGDSGYWIPTTDWSACEAA